jgi:hypothetical protein
MYPKKPAKGLSYFIFLGTTVNPSSAYCLARRILYAVYAATMPWSEKAKMCNDRSTDLIGSVRKCKPSLDGEMSQKTAKKPHNAR